MRRKPNARFENAASNRSQTSATDGGASSNLKRGKGGRVKPWTKTGCVLCVGAALVGGWASATVASNGNETKNAAKRPEVEKARLQALEDCRQPLPYEKLGFLERGTETLDNAEIVYRKVLIGKDWEWRKEDGTLCWTTLRRREYLPKIEYFYPVAGRTRSLDGWTRPTPLKTDDGKEVWSFFAEFEVDPENPRYKSVDGALLSKDGKTLYRYSSARPDASFKIPDGVERVAKRAFVDARLETVEFPASLKAIEENAFANCDALKSVTIPRGVVELGREAFEGCDALQTVEIESVALSISPSCFEGCVALSTVKLPSTLKRIEPEAFRGCAALTEIELPETLEEIGTRAFEKTGLKRLVAPSSLRWFPNLRDSTFEVEIAPNHPSFRGGDCFATSEDGKTLCWASRTSDGEAVVPDGVEIIDQYAFSGARFASVKLPETLRVIRQGAFEGCGNLTKITIPRSVERIEGRAFGECDALRTVEILSPNVLLVDDPFDPCPAFEAFEVPESNEGFKAVDGALLSKDGGTLFLVPYGTKATEYQVPEGVRNVFGDAFRGTKIKKIALPASVKDLGWSKPQHGRKYAKASALGKRKVEVAAENEYFASVDGMLLSKDGKKLYRYADDAVELRLPETVETLAEDAIISNKLERLVAPGVKRVEKDAIHATQLKETVYSEEMKAQ